MVRTSSSRGSELASFVAVRSISRMGVGKGRTTIGGMPCSMKAWSESGHSIPSYEGNALLGSCW